MNWKSGRFCALLAIALIAVAPWQAVAAEVSRPAYRSTIAPVTEPLAPANALTTLRCFTNVDLFGTPQDTLTRFGTGFDLGEGTRVSRVGFWHFGFETIHGPYTYDLEFWDMTTCARLGVVTDLVAADDFMEPKYEEIDVCAAGITLRGRVAFTIWPRTVIGGSSYPVILKRFESSPPGCYGYWATFTPSIPPPYSQVACDRPEYSFLIQVDINDCPVPAARSSWGRLKIGYR